MENMHPYEWWGRIALAVAIGLLFLVVVASMIVGSIFWPAIVVVVLIGVAGGVGMVMGSRV